LAFLIVSRSWKPPRGFEFFYTVKLIVKKI
jgi:hypothetical protein